MICSQERMRENVVPIPRSKFGAVWPGNAEVSENGLEVGRRHRDSRWAPPLGSMDSSPTEQSRKRGEVRLRAEPLVAKTTVGAAFYKCLLSADSTRFFSRPSIALKQNRQNPYV